MDETGASLYNESTMTLEKTDPFDVFILSSGRNEFYTYDPWMHGRAASLLATRPKGNREKLSYFTTSFTSYDYSYYATDAWPSRDEVPTRPGSDLVKTDGKYGYKYDANGNMTEKGSIYTELGNEVIITKEDEYFRYEYDLLNRLTKIYSLDEVTGDEVFVKSYVYNAEGMRITAEDSEGIKTQYTFDTGGKVVEKETDGIIRNFFYLGSKVIAHKENSEILYYGTDHLGSSVLMTDATGAAVWTGAVTPFADSETAEGLAEHVMFTGKELDTDTGLYYYNARWYDPNLGRFITEDPARDGVNWFIYVNNNPLNFIDPTGLEDQRPIVPSDQKAGWYEQSQEAMVPMDELKSMLTYNIKALKRNSEQNRDLVIVNTIEYGIGKIIKTPSDETGYNILMASEDIVENLIHSNQLIQEIYYLREKELPQAVSDYDYYFELYATHDAPDMDTPIEPEWKDVNFAPEIEVPDFVDLANDEQSAYTKEMKEGSIMNYGLYTSEE